MKKQISWFVVTIMVTLIACVTVDIRAADNKIPTGFGFTFGYRGLQIKDSKATFSHNTHPQDSFLTGAGVPGSAGKTSLEDTFGHFGVAGLRYQNLIIPEKLSYNIDIGGLFGGDRDLRQNVNDPRPASSGSFIYSEASFGFYGGVGIAYHFQDVMKGAYIGADVQITGLSVEHGYNRWGSDQSVKSEMLWMPSAGPKIGYHFENMNIELLTQFGKNVSFAISFGYFF